MEDNMGPKNKNMKGGPRVEMPRVVSHLEAQMYLPQGQAFGYQMAGQSGGGTGHHTGELSPHLMERMMRPEQSTCASRSYGSNTWNCLASQGVSVHLMAFLRLDVKLVQLCFESGCACLGLEAQRFL